VLRIDSPGGAVAPTQEIFDELQKVRIKKPLIASMGGMATSGGYYIASACEKIVANPGTMTGSIGVIMQLNNVEELMKKIGVKGQNIKSGANKDIGSPFKALSPEGQAAWTRLSSRSLPMVGSIPELRRRTSDWWMNWVIWSMQWIWRRSGLDWKRARSFTTHDWSRNAGGGDCFFL
jgi:hypothetical protein